jgi:VanZ family protein
LASGLSRHTRLQFFLRYWLPLIGYVGLIFTLSAQPNLRPPLSFENSDKLMHLLEYGGLGLVLFPLVRASNPARSALFTAVFALVCGLTIGAADENFQRTIPGRACDLFDWFADGTGVALAQFATFLWWRSRGE